MKTFRHLFRVPRHRLKEVAYFCGNSLGLQPKSTRKILREEIDDWAQQGVEGHFHARRPWFPYHELLTEKLARLCGAKPTEVVAMNSLTVNLHLLMVSFYRPTPERFKILIEQSAFPSDDYAAQSQLRFHGFRPEEGLIRLGPHEGEVALRDEDILSVIDREGDQLALILLPGVQYLTGQVFPMEEITRRAHAKGITVGFDLAHAVGNIPLRLHDWDVDFAVWCSYKYLNAGPGAVGGAFVHEKYANADLPKFWGWWGHDKGKRFLMESTFEPITGAESWQLSNPSIFAMAPLLASLEIFEQAGFENLQKRSAELSTQLAEGLAEFKNKVEVVTPKARGCQLSLRIAGGRDVHKNLLKSGVVADWREPDIIRAAPVPLYNTPKDIEKFLRVLKRSL